MREWETGGGAQTQGLRPVAGMPGEVTLASWVSAAAQGGRVAVLLRPSVFLLHIFLQNTAGGRSPQCFPQWAGFSDSCSHPLRFIAARASHYRARLLMYRDSGAFLRAEVLPSANNFPKAFIVSFHLSPPSPLAQIGMLQLPAAFCLLVSRSRYIKGQPWA